MQNAVKIHENDNVAVVLADMHSSDLIVYGTTAYEQLLALEAIPKYHKIAVEAIPQGTMIRKYGECIGIAKMDIEAGEHVHTHNVVSPRKEPL